MINNSDVVTIRPVTAVDIPHMVAIHCASFPTSRSTQLGLPFLQRMYRWYLTYQAPLSFVAELDGQIVGFVTGAIGGSSRKIFRYALRQIMGAFLRQPSLFFRSGMLEHWSGYLSGLLPKYKSGRQTVTEKGASVKATLDSIAVTPEARGTNVGKALVRAFEQAAVEQGATILGLGVELDNKGAQKLYESCGWKLARQNPAQNAANFIKEL